MRLSRRGRHGGDPVGGGPTVVAPVLSTEEASLAAEVLKVLYNLTCSLDKFHVEEAGVASILSKDASRAARE